MISTVLYICLPRDISTIDWTTINRSSTSSCEPVGSGTLIAICGTFTTMKFTVLYISREFRWLTSTCLAYSVKSRTTTHSSWSSSRTSRSCRKPLGRPAGSWRWLCRSCWCSRNCRIRLSGWRRFWWDLWYIHLTRGITITGLLWYVRDRCIAKRFIASKGQACIVRSVARAVNDFMWIVWVQFTFRKIS